MKKTYYLDGKTISTIEVLNSETKIPIKYTSYNSDGTIKEVKTF
ncbi:DUF2963 domain-containing protein [Paulownia witches'-broom phytoplasma]